MTPRERNVIRPSDPTRRQVTSGRIDRGGAPMRRGGNEAGRMARDGSAPRLYPSREVTRREVSRGSSDRAWSPRRSEGGRGNESGRSYDGPRRVIRSSSLMVPSSVFTPGVSITSQTSAPTMARPVVTATVVPG